MNRIIHCSGWILVVLAVFLMVPMIAYADATGGGNTATSVADAVHSAGEVASLADQFNAIMNQFDIEVSGERKKSLLQDANNILTKLIAQANDVESQVAILSQKKLDKVYASKLDRVLSNVQKMRQAAQSRMAVASRAS